MTRASARRPLPRHLAWLLALALWLPLAQLAAAAHALQHVQATSERGLPDPLPLACDICVVASAIGGAAPLPAALPQPPTLPPPHAQPVAIALPAPHAPPPAAYRSRAPPLPHA